MDILTYMEHESSRWLGFSDSVREWRRSSRKELLDLVGQLVENHDELSGIPRQDFIHYPFEDHLACSVWWENQRRLEREADWGE